MSSNIKAVLLVANNPPKADAKSCKVADKHLNGMYLSIRTIIRYVLVLAIYIEHRPRSSHFDFTCINLKTQ